jgi:hypothetical protein
MFSIKEIKDVRIKKLIKDSIEKSLELKKSIDNSEKMGKIELKINK